MRFDAVGLFWEDQHVGRGRDRVARVMPAIPDTGWQPLRDLPNLSSARVLSVDTETFDPELDEHGPGWARGVGHIAGISVAADNDGRWYFPIRHTVEPESNYAPERILPWLNDALSIPSQPKVGANLLYDIGWLRQEGVHVRGDLYDVQFAEALLSESSLVGLDHLAERYLGENKVASVLYQWCCDYYGGKPTGEQRKNLYRSPPRLVAPYAIGDVDIPLRVFERQYPRLVADGLLPVFRMECDLIPLLIEMRFAGVSVDVAQAEKVRDELVAEEALLNAKLKAMVGFDVNVDASESLARAFDNLGIPYGRTAPSKTAPNGKPSFTKGFLDTVEHDIGDLIRDIRSCQKTRGTFIESYILNSHINGKVFGQFHPLRGDDGGARSGRLSSSTPNLQNLPIRHERLGPLVRSIFVPDAGHKLWRKYDYSQIEYRFLAHYAVGQGADELRQTYNLNPDTDYHEEVRQMIRRITQVLLDRRPTKNINFGLVYGMGKPKLVRSLKLSKKEGDALFEAYHQGAPFVKETMDACIQEALTTGIITTFLGRRSRFELWESSNYQVKGPALPFERAIREYGQVRRSHTHKALNRRLQGSAADLMKWAMLRCWKDGVFAVTGVPRLTVHDELDFSDPGGVDYAFEYMKYVMETALQLRVPVRADCDVGPNWGKLKS